jgi:hypothetical protein
MIRVVTPKVIIKKSNIRTILSPLIFLIGSSAMKYVAIVSTNVKNTMKKVFAKIDVLPGG